jgi:hypothetical protein
MLLLAFTAAAIGFPIWYRWPYTEESQLPADKRQPPVYKLVTTWRRTWGGGRVKDGPETRESPDGKFRVVKNYKDGVLDGPYTEYYRDKELVVGQYIEDKKTGRWERRSARGDIEFGARWNDGKLDGLAEMRRPDGSTMPLRFQAGSLVEIDGELVSYSLADLKNRVRAGSERLSKTLDDPSMLELIETPLKDALQFLTDLHGIPAGQLRIERSRVNADLPVTANLSDIDLLSGLAIIAGLNDLGLDYRYGCLWITDDAAEWTEPTGVLAIQPEAGSSLAEIWSEPVSVSTFFRGREQPLAKVLQSLATQLGIEIDTTQVESAPNRPDANLNSFHMNGHPFHQTLGILLYETGCRAELVEGTLVILPPENLSQPRE